MNIPDEQSDPEEPTPSQESLSEEVIFPEEPELPEGFTPLDGRSRLPRARRRRSHRMFILPGAEERAALLDDLARRASPSFEFFLFALFCGAVLGAAYLLDSPAVLLLGLLLAPLLTPWAGLTLAIMTGSWRFFFLMLGGMLVASLLVFLTGALAGAAGQLWMPLRLFNADLHSHLWWPDLVLVALGAALLAISFVRSEQKPVVPSIMLAYGLFLPLSAGAVGLGLGVRPIWPNGIWVFLAHLALAVVVGGITLAALRFKPVKAGGYLLPILVGLCALAALVSLTGLTKVVRDGILATRQIAPTPTVLALPSKTPPPLPTETPFPSPTVTPGTPSSTPTDTATPEPTPAYAIISAPEQYGGAVVRSEPGTGPGIAVLANGSLIQVLPETSDFNGVTWARIRMDNGTEGWVLQAVLVPTTRTFIPTATPTPLTP